MVNPDECILRSSCLCPEGEPSDIKTCGTSPEKNPDTPSARMKFFPVPVDSHLCSTLKFHPVIVSGYAGTPYPAIHLLPSLCR
jgi:hypothetical protein